MQIEAILRAHGLGGGGNKGSGSVLIPYYNTVTLATAAATVSIGIPQYNKTKDTLMVFQNSTYVSAGAAYTIAGDSTSITATTGTFASGTIFNFVVLSSTPSTDALNTVMLTNLVTVATNATTNIAHGITAFNQASDILEAFMQSSLMYPGDAYTLATDGLSINLTGFQMNSGDKVFFRVWKKVKQSMSQINAITLMDNTVTNTKMVPDAKIGSLALLSTTTKTDLVSALNELFLNVSNGKTSIATAITGMGVAAAGSDTFAQLSTKISNISKDATATVAQILLGQTAYIAGAKATGTMPNNGAVTITPSNAAQTIVAGYHNGSGTVAAVVVPAANVLTGTTIAGVAGTMPNNGAVTITPSNVAQAIVAGYHNGSGTVSAVTVPAANVLTGTTIAGVAGTMPNLGALSYTPSTVTQTAGAGYTSGVTVAGDANLVAVNILTGKTIFGVAGSAGGYKMASGTGSTLTMPTWSYTVSGLSFTPSYIIFYSTANWQMVYVAGDPSGSNKIYTTSPAPSAYNGTSWTVPAGGFTVSSFQMNNYGTANFSWVAFGP